MYARLPWLLSSFLLFGGVFGCGDDDAPPLDGGGDAGLTGISALFAPAADPIPWGAVPFPDDLYLDADGRVALADYPNEARSEYASYVESLRETLGWLDGFGVVSPIFFPLDAAVDPGSLPASSADSLLPEATAFLLDADPASPTAFQRIPVEARRVPAEVAGGVEMVALRPADGYPLAPRGRYAAVLTTHVRGATGERLRPAPAFEALRDGSARPEDATLGEAWDRYQPVIASLGTAGVARDEIAALAVFRVQSVVTDLEDVRAALWAEDAPEVRVEAIVSGDGLDALLGVPSEPAIGFGAPGGVLHDAIGWIVQGSFDAPWYLHERAGVHGPFERDGERVRVKRTERVPFSLVLPASASSASPVPVVVFQHGLTADRSDALGVAQTLCAAGYAVVAIDAPYHGLRALGGDVDTVHRFTGAAGPDGFGDRRGAAIIIDFAGLQDFAGDLMDFHPYYFRDAMRQGSADLLALVRTLRGADWSLLAEEDASLAGIQLAPDRLGFIGYSLGGILGAMFVAVEPEVGAAVLAFTGGSIVHAVSESPAFNPTYLPQLFPLVGLDPSEIDYEALHPSFYPGIALWQTLFDRGDSIAYARRLRRGGANLLLPIARHDETLPNVNSEALARALAIPMVGGEPLYVGLELAALPLRANVVVEAGTRTRGAQLWDPANHGALLWRTDSRTYTPPPRPPFRRMASPTPIDNPVDAVQGQVLRFFESWRAGTAEISLAD
ncbi:MAG: hypothetical protein KF901_07610 [Myxococcales bacterium]|nr:hypothetical protein [Myxococcales bacterium]